VAKKKKRKKQKPNYKLKDSHHILYQKRHWCRGYLKVLREHDYCVIDIPRDTLHRQIHEWLGDIPIPSDNNAKEVLRNITLLEKQGAISNDDPLERRLTILIALFDCIEQPTADALRKQLKITRDFYEKPP
jgi:hypothetical protein